MTTTADDQIEKECPLCMEQLDLDELNFFPCKCGYQVCQFCWNRIKQEENGLCPACRQPYPDQPVDFKPFSAEELKKIQLERRKRDQQRKQKMSENRKHLANMRVVQKNLVLVHGMPPRLCDPETLRKCEYFGQFGKIQKIAFGTNNPPANATTSNSSISQTASASVYVTYAKEEEAVKAIMALNQRIIDGKILRASLGTTKYCSCFLQNKPCQKTDCMYLHEVADSEASFTKEDMATKRHEDYERKVCEEILLRITSNNSILQQRGDVFPCTSNESSNFGQKTSRENSITPQSLTTTVGEQATTIANPLPASPISQSNADYAKNYRANIAPRHHKKLDATVKVTSSSPIDIPSEQQQNSSDRSSSAQQNIATKPLLSTSATNLHLSGSATNLDHSTSTSAATPVVAAGAVLQCLSDPAPSEQTNLLQRHSVAGQLSASPNFDVASFLRQQSSAGSFASSNGGQNQSLYNQPATQTPKGAHLSSSSFFSHDDDSSYFYKQRLKSGQSSNDEKLAGVAESLSSMVALSGMGTTIASTASSSSLLDFILGTNKNSSNNLANKNTGQLEQFNRQNLANGLSLSAGNSSILDRFSRELSDCFPVANEILKTKSKPQDDWQTSAAFNKSDDDLGFDPIFESSKALEDLLREEKEKDEKLRQMAASQRLHSFQHQTQPGLSNQSFTQISQNQLGSSSKANVPLKMPPHHIHQATSNLWPMSNPLQQQPIQHGLHGIFGNGVSTGGPSGSFFHDSHTHNTNLLQSAMFRFNNSGTSTDFSQCAPKVLNAVPPGAFNGLNAQAAPFIPRQVNPSGHHQTGSSTTAANQSVRDMQEQFRSFFPEASVKFQQLASTMSAAVPPSLPPPLPSSVGVLTSANLRPATGWSGPRTVDPRQSLFSRPPPPLGPPHSAAAQQANMPPQLSYPANMRPTTVTAAAAAAIKLTSQSADLSLSGAMVPPSTFHHGYARLGGMSSAVGSALVAPFGAPPTLGQNFNTEYPNWSLTPTPPPGFAPSSHQSPS